MARKVGGNLGLVPGYDYTNWQQFVINASDMKKNRTPATETGFILLLVMLLAVVVVIAALAFMRVQHSLK